jgi:hypothetical protein
MNRTEKEYNLLPIKKDVDQIIHDLGINMADWYFGEATEGSDYFSVYFGNEKAENHSLNVDFLLKNKEWVLERCEINHD